MTASPEVPKPATVESLDHACALVGRVLWQFSKLEAAIDYGLRRFLSLEEDQGEIVAVNVDFVRKTKIVRSAISAEKDRSDPEALKRIDSMFDEVRKLNDYRIVVAHSQFDLKEGAVSFKRATADAKLKRQDPSWDLGDFESLYKRMTELAAALETAMKEVKSYREHIEERRTDSEFLKQIIFGDDAPWMPDLA